MTFGSLFSGVGGLDLGLERAGHRVMWQVEKDRACRSVLRRHWPSVDLHEDVRHVGRADFAPVDLVCGGFPCQDVSVAGRRAGLGGERSGLWFEFLRIVTECAPRWVLIENVPGLRSSNGGGDLAVIVRGLAQLGYLGAWRSLDSQHFGVAQRRERIFLLARLGSGGPGPAEVLAIPEGLSGHPAPGRQAGEITPALSASGSGTSRPGGQRPEADFYALANTVPYRKAQKAHHADDGERWEEAEAAGTLGAHSPTTGHVIAHTLKAEGHDAGEDGTGRGVPIVAQCHGSNVGEFGPLRSGNGGVTGGVPFVAETLRVGGRDQGAGDSYDNTPVIAAAINPGHEGKHSYAGDGGIMNVVGAIPRRLTPRECERLQGFPDDWTRYDDKGKELADSPRYRMMGNAVTVNVAEWIGRHLLTVLEGEP